MTAWIHLKLSLFFAAIISIINLQQGLEVNYRYDSLVCEDVWSSYLYCPHNLMLERKVSETGGPGVDWWKNYEVAGKYRLLTTLLTGLEGWWIFSGGFSTRCSLSGNILMWPSFSRYDAAVGAYEAVWGGDGLLVEKLIREITVITQYMASVRIKAPPFS